MLPDGGTAPRPTSRRRRRAAAASVSALVLVLAGCGGGDADRAAPSGRDATRDVYDARLRRITATRPELDLRTAGVTVEDRVLRLTLSTAAPLRTGVFTFATQACDIGGLLVVIRVTPAGDAAVIRTVDPARPHLRVIGGTRASVDGTHLTATVPLREDADLARAWIAWSADADDEFADSVPDIDADGNADPSHPVPTFGNDDCGHPEIRLIR